MKIDQLIKNLKDSNLYAECSCGEEFKLSDAFLFDGTKPFPAEALGTQSELNTLLETRNAELAKKKKLATEGAERTTTAVNIGKNLERALPTIKGFKWVVLDSKFLSDPIDLLIFNGLSNGKVDSLSFVEVKSGKYARLNSHQKSIRDAIGDHKVSYEVFV
jgi:predicted Holliday junction resolvase-like endonuclease